MSSFLNNKFYTHQVIFTSLNQNITLSPWTNLTSANATMFTTDINKGYCLIESIIIIAMVGLSGTAPNFRFGTTSAKTALAGDTTFSSTSQYQVCRVLNSVMTQDYLIAPGTTIVANNTASGVPSTGVFNFIFRGYYFGQ